MPLCMIPMACLYTCPLGRVGTPRPIHVECCVYTFLTPPKSPISAANVLLIIGLETPRAASPITTGTNTRPTLQRRATSQPPPQSKVRFNLSPQPASPTSSGPSSPTQIRRRRQRESISNNASHHSSGYDSDDPDEHRSSDQSRRQSRGKNRDDHGGRRGASPASSESTVDLPERFDQYGRPLPEKGENEFADKFQEILAGKGSMGKLLKSWGLTGDGSEDEGGSGGGRRRRRR